MWNPWLTWCEPWVPLQFWGPVGCISVWSERVLPHPLLRAVAARGRGAPVIDSARGPLGVDPDGKKAYCRGKKGCCQNPMFSSKIRGKIGARRSFWHQALTKKSRKSVSSLFNLSSAEGGCIWKGVRAALNLSQRHSVNVLGSSTWAMDLDREINCTNGVLMCHLHALC